MIRLSGCSQRMKILKDGGLEVSLNAFQSRSYCSFYICVNSARQKL
jgi:hypothetical protein